MAFESENIGLFIPTSNIWDVSQLMQIDVNSDSFKELLVRLYQNLNNIAIAVNLKDSGFYDNTMPFVNGQVWFSNPVLNSTTPTAPSLRQVFRLVVNFGALPAAGTKSVAHGLTITSSYTFTRIYGAASDTTGFKYIPLPFASPVLNENIKLDVDANNVNITVGINRSNYNACYVVLEYITS